MHGRNEGLMGDSFISVTVASGNIPPRVSDVDQDMSMSTCRPESFADHTRSPALRPAVNEEASANGLPVGIADVEIDAVHTLL